MRKPQGYATWTDPSLGQLTKERDTFTCCHCNTIVIVEPKADPSSLGGFCMMCSKNVCTKCVGKRCDPFEKKLERAESRSRMLRAIGV